MVISEQFAYNQPLSLLEEPFSKNNPMINNLILNYVVADILDIQPSQNYKLCTGLHKLPFESLQISFQMVFMEDF